MEFVVADRGAEEGAGGEVGEVVAAGVEPREVDLVGHPAVLGLAGRLVVAQDGDRGGAEYGVLGRVGVAFLARELRLVERVDGGVGDVGRWPREAVLGRGLQRRGELERRLERLLLALAGAPWARGPGIGGRRASRPASFRAVRASVAVATPAWLRAVASRCSVASSRCWRALPGGEPIAAAPRRRTPRRRAAGACDPCRRLAVGARDRSPEGASTCASCAEEYRGGSG